MTWKLEQSKKMMKKSDTHEEEAYPYVGESTSLVRGGGATALRSVRLEDESDI